MSTRRPHRRKTPADPCGVEGCAKTAEAHDLCHGHYQRWQRHGDVQADRPIGRQGALCAVDGCQRPSESWDMCKAHYNRTVRHGDPRAEEPIRVTSGLGSVSHGYRNVPVPRNERKLSNGKATELEHRLVRWRDNWAGRWRRTNPCITEMVTGWTTDQRIWSCGHDGSRAVRTSSTSSGGRSSCSWSTGPD